MCVVVVERSMDEKKSMENEATLFVEKTHVSN